MTAYITPKYEKDMIKFDLWMWQVHASSNGYTTITAVLALILLPYNFFT